MVQLFKFDNLKAFSLCLRPDPHAPAFLADLVLAPHAVAPPARAQHRCPACGIRAFLAAHPTITHLTIAGPIMPDAPDGIFVFEGVLALVSFVGPFHHLEHIPRPEVIETLSITSPVAHVGFPRLVSALARFPALTRLDLPLIFAPAAAAVAALRTACPGLVCLGLLFAAYVDLPPTTVAALAHALRAFPLRTLALVKACAAPERAGASAAALLHRLPRLTTVRVRLLRADSAQSVQEAGTYERVGGSDVFASERGRGLFGKVFASRYRMALAEFVEGNVDVGTAEDEDESLEFVPPGGGESAPHLVRPYGFVHEHMWHGSTGAAPWAWAVETSECACSRFARADFSRGGAWSWL
ncbi:hypothetical protein FB451DRAFT_1452444 [Mycena latifolia]|nr:hypothetical protein FB451DRAFT_1452444 [Mycena latifolia]